MCRGGRVTGRLAVHDGTVSNVHVPVKMRQMQMAHARASEHERKEAEAEANRETDQIKIRPVKPFETISAIIGFASLPHSSPGR